MNDETYAFVSGMRKVLVRLGLKYQRFKGRTAFSFRVFHRANCVGKESIVELQLISGTLNFNGYQRR